MPLEPGQRLGPYRIVELLGVGGMGEVYRGRDSRLGRDVALKVIAPALIGDATHRARFELEARASSALNHPSIVTIYDVGETDGLSWIAMEWVDGRTLREAIAEGPLAAGQALAIARQVAEGLAAAHAKGIVHRDLKPENIMLAADGRAKILDFGLARHALADGLDVALGDADTIATPAQTVRGTILGTVGYMSPEQAAGRPVDFRSDQFALGLVLYEMLSGRRAFAGGSVVETLAAIIRDEPPPLSGIRTGLSDGCQRVVARCLAKRPDERFESTRDLAATLEMVGAAPSTGTTTAAVVLPTARPRRVAIPRRAALVVAMAVLAALAAGVAWSRLRPAPASIGTLAVLPFRNAAPEAGLEYLGSGITESLIAQMSRAPSLKVLAHSTVFRYRDAPDPREVGRALEVAAIVTGTVARSGSQLVVAAELIDVATGSRLWGQTYARPAADLLQVEDSLAADIADALRLRLSSDKGRIGGYSTHDPGAYELFLKGRFLMISDTEEEDLEARALFQQALERDPSFVEARLGLAGTWARSAGNGYAPPAEGWTRQAEHLRKVLETDPQNVAARAGLAGRRFLFEWDWSGAEREFREISADPQLFLGNHYHPVVMFLWSRGRPDEAVALLERALRVDPGNVESRVMMADLLVKAGRLDEAVRAYSALAAAEPADARPLFGLADVLKRRGDLLGAIEALRNAYRLAGEEYGVRALAGAVSEQDYARAQRDVARVRLGHLEALAEERYISPLDLARLYAQVGDRARAFEQLEAALKERSSGLAHLKVDEAWDGVRDDPRFAAVVLQVGIP